MFCLDKICEEPERLFNLDKLTGLKAPPKMEWKMIFV